MENYQAQGDRDSLVDYMKNCMVLVAMGVWTVGHMEAMRNRQTVQNMNPALLDCIDVTFDETGPVKYVILTVHVSKMAELPPYFGTLVAIMQGDRFQPHCNRIWKEKKALNGWEFGYEFLRE